MANPIECTLVIPCYNEARRLRPEEFLRAAGAIGGLELLFVDDGSNDATGALVAELAARFDPPARVLGLPANRGKAEAVRQGMLAARESRPDFIGFWDADLATPLDVLPLLLARLRGDENLHAALASRVKLLGAQIERRAWRHYLGRIFATAASLCLGLPVYDTQCGAKVFRHDELLAAAIEAPFVSRWLFDVELLARYCMELRRRGVRPETALIEVPTPFWRDVRGSKLRLRDFLFAPLQLARIRLRYRYRSAGS